MEYPLIFEVSSDISVFQVPGSPHVISRVPGFNSVLTNSAKGSLNWIPLAIKLRQSKIKPLRQVVYVPKLLLSLSKMPLYTLFQIVLGRTHVSIHALLKVYVAQSANFNVYILTN